MSLAESFRLDGRVALVTGASRGLGAAIARGLAEAGADVAVAGRRASTLAETVAAVEALERRAYAVELDVRSLAATVAAVAAVETALGPVDILVANAGVEEVRPSMEVDEGLWDRILDTNLKGAFFAAQAAGRGMAGRGGGAIVTLCSLTSFFGVGEAAPYTASKSGLLGMTRALSAEWAPHGVRVNAVAPGYFRTELTEPFFDDPAWQEAMVAKIPLGRFGRREDVCGAVVFLASPAAAYVTGQCLGIDGGLATSL